MKNSADFLRCYEDELAALRQASRAFAAEYPSHAGSLRLEDVADPSIARLSEAVAFLAARSRVRVARSEESLARELLARVVPFLSAPIPSLAVVALNSQLGVDGLAEPISVNAGSELLLQGNDGGRPVVFRTVRSIEIQPIELLHANLLTLAALPVSIKGACSTTVHGAMRFRFRRGDADLAPQRGLASMQLYLKAKPPVASQVLGALLSNASAAYVLDESGRPCEVNCDLHWPDVAERWLPQQVSDFNVYRRLVEFFACPEAWQFLDLNFCGVAGNDYQLGTQREFDVYVPLGRNQYESCQQAGAVEWCLGAVPVVNAVERRTDRIAFNLGRADLKLYVDRLAATAHEILAVTAVDGYFNDGRRAQIPDISALGRAECGLRYHFKRELLRPWRERDAVSYRARKLPSGYGRESVTQAMLAIIHLDSPQDYAMLESVSVRCLVSDGDRPHEIWRAGGFFTRSDSLGDINIEWLVGPRRSHVQHLVEPQAWRLVELLRPAAEWLMPASGVAGDRLRGLLRALSLSDNPEADTTVDAVRNVQIRECVSRIPGNQRLAFCRGLQVELQTTDTDLLASPLYVFSCLLNRVLAEMSALNSFTELVLVNQGRLPGWRFPPRVSSAAIL